jgi:hypothetical protein
MLPTPECCEDGFAGILLLLLSREFSTADAVGMIAAKAARNVATAENRK